MTNLRSSCYGVLIVLIIFLLHEECSSQGPRDPRDPTNPYNPQRPWSRPQKPQKPRGGYYPPRVNRPEPRKQACEQGSCYPATGNLLIGRENRLRASSTCGLRVPERYCIVSHLAEETNCFLCDTRKETTNDPLKNHRIGNIIYEYQPGTRQQTWWQSENGKGNVTIQLDLEAEFHFTHLMITFSTFRPAAMLIERSYDFGHTWHVYQYFAYNCDESFSFAPKNHTNITDVICTDRYSAVEPSKDGEVIYRVLPPDIKIENPYAPHVQNMLKMTNLRINFTKLHNLGDTLLDDREEIQEKYYYGIKNMVVRGSCSCYGHASSCLPLDGMTNVYDMVHGRCKCTHHTKGLNCEQCEDFYNDLPWKPALGKQQNACQECTCNNHTKTCHFDEAVYAKSIQVSGGVCDNCQDNTQGQHCDECITYFYRDPNEPITSPYVCKPCDCDPRGSNDGGVCESLSDPENGKEAGACRCKANTKGRRCDMCKDGFWNLDENNPEGCQNCTCNILGTHGNSGCNMYTGECTCKRNVIGKDCNQCLPQTYGLSDNPDGCTPCNCHITGAYDNFCDVLSGQCRCRPHMTGRTCNQPLQNYFLPTLHKVFEAESANITECITYSKYGNCSVYFQPQSIDGERYVPGIGFLRVHENSELTINVDGVPKTTNYDVIIRFMTQSRGNWEVSHITLIRPDDYDADGNCSNSHPYLETRVPFVLPESENKVIALPDVCLEENKFYKFKIYFERQRRTEDNPAAQILIDSISLTPQIRVTPLFSGSREANDRWMDFIRFGCNHTYYDIEYDEHMHHRCKDFLDATSIIIYGDSIPCNCNPTGSLSKQCARSGGKCQCKPNIIGRQCDRCAPGTYGFGPEGCKACDCNNIGARDNDCDLITGQCNCYQNTYGRECDQCQPGFWNFPNCQWCQCNSHASACDSRTGQCIDCEDFTTGNNCDRCIEGYYGNPLLGSEIGCRPCRCPDTVASGHSHSDGCALDHRNNDMICYCKEGYTGSRCDICADNYFGDPEISGGSCKPCNCSNNIAYNNVGNCDRKTGQCLKCLHDTTGDHCEICRDGYYGDALRQTCRPCHCDVLGTNQTLQFCNRITGQCPCLKNVHGVRCDECIPNHWKIATGEGCEPCDCELGGAEMEQCNTYDGQCKCRPEFGGRRCNQCQSNFWGNPNIRCHACDCDIYGSAKPQCDRETGQCVCNPGIGGYKCNQCARGYLGQSPHCSACGECFDNWDLILNNLKADTELAIARAKQIKTIGAAGAYTTEFNGMESKLNTIQQLLDNTTVSIQDINELDLESSNLRELLKNLQGDVKTAEEDLNKIYAEINVANVQLEALRNKSSEISELSKQLKENSTQLQEENVEGALNLTRDALNRVNALSEILDEAKSQSANSELQCKWTEGFVNRTKAEFDELLAGNNRTLREYEDQLKSLNNEIPDLNKNMCGNFGDDCKSLCGGAKCGTCGGVYCTDGAFPKAGRALTLAKDTEKAIQEKKEESDNFIRSLLQAKTNASQAFAIAQESFNDAEMFLNQTNEQIRQGDEIIVELNNQIDNTTASPAEIEDIAKKTLALNLELDPSEIKVLADKIDTVVQSLENVDDIIASTRNDLYEVKLLGEQAENVRKEADSVLNTANTVVEALKEAEEAQSKAQTAIQNANSDIKRAEDDLEKIDIETSNAEHPANKTAETIDAISKKLIKIQRNIAGKNYEANETKKEADSVKQLASNAHEYASQLKNQFKQANDSLTNKAKSSESSRLRAQQLSQRASKLTVDTEAKLTELQSMMNLYQMNDKKLIELQNKLKSLSTETTEYFDKIQTQASYYKSCTS